MAERPVVTRATLCAHLRDLGLGSGDVVLFHSSLKSIGWVEPGPESVIEAFLEVLGPEGTLVAPSLVHLLQGPRPLFSVEDSPSDFGLLPEVLRRWPGARRSDHPSHAVAALGRLAEEITAGHGQAWGPTGRDLSWRPNVVFGPQALGVGSPWDKLYALNAWVLLIGVGFNRCTLFHHVQARYLARHWGVTAETPFPSFDLRRQGERLETAGVVRRGRLGNAECRLARAGDIVDKTLAMLETRPREIFAPQGPVVDWLDTLDHIERFGRARAAAFKVDITPASPPLPVARPLHARGLILDDPRRGRAALIVCDHYGLYPGEVAVVRRAVAAAAGVPFEATLVTCTNDHSAYMGCGALVRHGPRWSGDPAYVSWLASRLGPAAAESISRLEPVRAGWAAVPAPGINRNRTVHLRDGRAYSEHWAMPSTWFTPLPDIVRRGPDDPDVRLLVLERLDRTRLAVLADFSCHNSAGMDDPATHDDFSGIAMEQVEQTEGHGCVALCTPGSGGDQEPMGLVELGGTRDLTYARKLGLCLGSAILSGAQRVTVHDVFPIAVASEAVEVAVRADWRTGAAAPPAVPAAHPEWRVWAADGRLAVDVVALAVGDFALAGIPAALFTTPARRIREHAPFPCVAVAGQTNGTIMYVAEQEAYVAGTLVYGVMPQPEAMAEPGTDQILSAAALRALRRAKGRQAHNT